jgi:hypothetical protein
MAVASRHADPPKLRPATREEFAQLLARAALQRQEAGAGADEIMANITAERPIEHLERSGYVSD